MLKIKVITIGSLKENYLKDLVAEYTKRLSRYCQLQTIELDEIKIQNENNQDEILKALEKEKEKVEQQLHKSDFIISLCVEGKQISSEEFAKTIGDLSLEGYSSLAFVIGSSHGLSQEIKQKSQLKLSFSKMTFPHQLMRGILLEQIYRGFQIQSGGKYHK